MPRVGNPRKKDLFSGNERGWGWGVFFETLKRCLFSFGLLFFVALSACQKNQNLLQSQLLTREELQEIFQFRITAYDFSPEELSRLQRESLKNVFSSHGALPSEPSAQEVESAWKKLESSALEERSLMPVLFNADRALLAIAMRDTDGDGIRDFSVAEMDGKFFEKDIDLDGDGVPNLVDPDPYHPQRADAKPADTNQNGIPDIVDLSLLNSPEVGAVQTRLFRDYGILIFQRDLEWTEEMAANVELAFKIYRPVFRKHSKTPNQILRAIGLEKACALQVDGTYALMDGYSKVLTFLERTLSAEPLIQLSVIVHEIAHSFQFAMESFDEKSNTKPVAQSDFLPLMTTLGWSAPVTVKASESGHFQLTSPYWTSFEEGEDYSYGPYTTSEWAALLAKVAKENDPRKQHYLKDPRLSKYHIVNDYSLTTPYEFHSEATTAALWIALRDRLAAKSGLSDEIAKTASTRFFENVLDADSGYAATRYFQAEGSNYISYFTDWLGLENETLDSVIDQLQLQLE